VGTFYSEKRGFSYVLVRHFSVLFPSASGTYMCTSNARGQLTRFSFRLRSGATKITTVFLDRIPSAVTRFVRTCCLCPRSGRKQTFPLEPRWVFTGLLRVMSLKAVIVNTKLSSSYVKARGCFSLISQEEYNFWKKCKFKSDMYRF